MSSFFQKAGVEISEESIEKVGLTVHDLFGGMNKAVFRDLGVTSELQQNMVLKAIQDLDNNITHGPGDFFEWRVANMRLFHTWILPLGVFAPRVTAIWARYFTTHYGPDHGANESAFEKVDDVWDSVSEGEFWLTWLLCPYYPQFKIGKEFHVSDSEFFMDICDKFFYYFTAVQCALSTLMLLKSLHQEKKVISNRRGKKKWARSPFESHLKNLIMHEVDAFFTCLLLYYIGWSFPLTIGPFLFIRLLLVQLGVSGPAIKELLDQLISILRAREDTQLLGQLPTIGLLFIRELLDQLSRSFWTS
jgi:hypothetical protein